jgi:hypothetical protein
MDTPFLEATDAGMDEQLSTLYAEKELLLNALGVSDAEDIITMVRSLEEQLSALYAELA